jgi:CHAD domain-containing protein
MRRVLKEQGRAREELAPGPIHDLRVALRRCRSLAEGFAQLDGHADWRQMRKAARRLQRGLADLRDAQVMAAWLRRLHLAPGAGGAVLAASFRREEQRARRAARRALEDFSRKRWKRWRRRLPRRAERIAAGPASFAPLALQRLADAGELHRRWRKSASRIAAHRLRIAVKRFRYVVESFLPEQHAAWGRDLKRLQDWLGEVHDLDVLRGRILQLAEEESFPRTTADNWVQSIERARKERVERYRRAVSPKTASAKRAKQGPVLWDRWRQELELLATINHPRYAEASRSRATAVAPRAQNIS